ncbi:MULTISPECIES: hypothetical protein [Arthrobacter]|uniref:Lipoprotein with Yx(FWY)xxD motif n=2 Tax=Arthrobacter TaxID=1663 RepID=A0ABU9KP29_9MICC|nr:hypothetical protein [Arthrobacter sp. YJM1]MDP5228640.1 hypothetical protein [Arthrobacter sp. YJM1]
MNKRPALLVASLAAAAGLALTGCGSGSGSGGYGGSAPTSSAPSSMAPSSMAPSSSSAGGGYGGGDYGGGSGSTPAAGALTLKTATVAGKSIVVDGKGDTVYIFTPDGMNATKSACLGACAAMWPAVESDSAPTLQGVTAKTGSITGSDGKMQVTVAGMPIYFFSHDTAPGQVNGQGVNGVWYVLGADGTVIKDSLK